MTDESDARDHEREEILDRDLHKIRIACDRLMDLSENVRDIGLDKLADNIDIIWTEIRKDITCIQDRYEFLYKIKERKHFRIEDV